MILIYRLFKYAVIITFAICLNILLATFSLRMTLGYLSKWGQTGTVCGMLLLSNIIPILSAMIGVGVLGGLWLKEKPYTGFVLSIAFILIWTGILGSRDPYKINIGSGLLVLSVFLVTIAGGMTYRAIIRILNHS